MKNYLGAKVSKNRLFLTAKGCNHRFFCNFAVKMEGNKNLNIDHPEVWDLLVAIEDRRVSYILYTPQVANSLIVGEAACADETLQSIEDAVYETPVLLGDYHRVKLMVRSSRFLLLPCETSDDDGKDLLRQAFPDEDGDVAVCLMPQCGVKIVYLMPQGMLAFLGRTFNYPEIYHHLFPLCEHFERQHQHQGISKMFLNLHEEEMDIILYREGLLQCANTFPFTNSQDASYFALNAWRTYGLDQLTDELQLMGDNAVRASMTPELRKFVKYVMPAVYPAAAMRLGRNALQAPLELILLALCES